MSQLETKDRILDAAENLFSDKGFSATSLRSITTLAGANLAAVNYHFGSKDALIQAVFRRILTPLNNDRLQRLDALEARVQEPSVDEVLTAFLTPVATLWSESKRGPVLVRLFAKTFAEPSTNIRDLVFSEFEGIAARYIPALARAVPHLSRREVMTRLHFLIGSMTHTVTNWDMLAGAPGADELIEQMVTYGAAGFRAPAALTTSKGTP